MVANIDKERFAEYSFGRSRHLSALDPENITSLITSGETTPRPTRVLSGRGFVKHFSLPEVGDVVLKQYHRGGLLGKVNSSYYMKFGKTRPEREYQLLETVRSLSVNAPEPLAWITSGGCIYQGWLLMKEIPHSYSLADIAERSQEEIEPVLKSFALQVERLIMAGVYHVDLHPGNVLVDSAGTVSIIDFDKARPFKESLNKLRNLYLCRWRRAVIKHGLPDFLAEYVCAFLLKNFTIQKNV